MPSTWFPETGELSVIGAHTDLPTRVHAADADAGHASRRPLIVEVVGPAGAGKSSLVRALRAGDDTIRRSRSLRAADVALIARRAPRWLPIMSRLALTSPGIARQYARHLVRIEAMDALFPRDTAAGAGVVLLDEGPVFSMALMLAFNEDARGYGTVAEHVVRSANRWASMLDAVVWLDADDAVLTRRIQSREKAHRIKEAAAETAREFLRRYRRAYDTVATRLAAAGTVSIIRIDTATTSTAAIAARVRATLLGLRHAR